MPDVQLQRKAAEWLRVKQHYPANLWPGGAIDAWCLGWGEILAEFVEELGCQDDGPRSANEAGGYANEVQRRAREAIDDPSKVGPFVLWAAGLMSGPEDGQKAEQAPGEEGIRAGIRLLAVALSDCVAAMRRVPDRAVVGAALDRAEALLAVAGQRSSTT